MASEGHITNIRPTPSTPRKRRRSSRSSDEQAYAGPAEQSALKSDSSSGLPTPSPTPSPPRARRTGGLPDEFTPQDKDGIRVEERRVGGPHLCRLPAKTSIVRSDDPISTNWKVISPKVSEIVQRHGISKTQITVTRRSWWKDTRAEKHWPITITIWAMKYTTEELWHGLCSEILSLLTNHGYPDLNVEIIDPEVAKPTISYPLRASDTIVTAWPDLKTQIIEIVKSTDCSALQLLRRGKDAAADRNPVTVVLTIPENSSDDWVNVREQIVTILDKHQFFHVAVEIGIGTNWHGLDIFSQPLPDRAWEIPAQAGISMGPFRTWSSSATFGGFVELQDAKGHWTRYGITCHHAALPEHPIESFPFDAATLRQWHQEGFPPDSSVAEQIRYSQPSVADNERCIQYWRDLVREYENQPRYIEIRRKREANEPILPWDLRYFEGERAEVQRLSEMITMAKKFFEEGKNELGTIYASSGLRRSDRRSTLDWTIIKITPARMSINSMPLPEHLPSRARAIYRPNADGVPRRSTTPLQGMEDLFKVGRTTEGTWGKYNGIKATSFPRWGDQNASGKTANIECEDHMVVGWPPFDKPFADRGDSGAFVFDKYGDVVGLLVGVNDWTSTAYFTSLDELFRDIRHITGVADVRLS